MELESTVRRLYNDAVRNFYDAGTYKDLSRLDQLGEIRDRCEQFRERSVLSPKVRRMYGHAALLSSRINLIAHSLEKKSAYEMWDEVYKLNEKARQAVTFRSDVSNLSVSTIPQRISGRSHQDERMNAQIKRLSHVRDATAFYSARKAYSDLSFSVLDRRIGDYADALRGAAGQWMPGTNVPARDPQRTDELNNASPVLYQIWGRMAKQESREGWSDVLGRALDNENPRISVFYDLRHAPTYYGKIARKAIPKLKSEKSEEWIENKLVQQEYDILSMLQLGARPPRIRVSNGDSSLVDDTWIDYIERTQVYDDIVFTTVERPG